MALKKKKKKPVIEGILIGRRDRCQLAWKWTQGIKDSLDTKVIEIEKLIRNQEYF